MPDGSQRILPIVRTPDDLPTDASMIVVRPRTREPVPAHIAQSDGEIVGSDGHALRYTAGEHYLVEHRTGDVSVIRRDIFEKTYHQKQPGLYRKRPNLRLRAVVADEDTQVETLEGAKIASRGDWIMIGVANELWPVPAHQARETYREAAAVSFTSVGVVVLLVFALLTYVAIVAG
jgi:hypothetical protein